MRRAATRHFPVFLFVCFGFFLNAVIAQLFSFNDCCFRELIYRKRDSGVWHSDRRCSQNESRGTTATGETAFDSAEEQQQTFESLDKNFNEVLNQESAMCTELQPHFTEEDFSQPRRESNGL